MRTFLSLLLALAVIAATIVVGRAALEILTGRFISWMEAITVLVAISLTSLLVRE